jgi:hypothetical protein
VFKKKEITLSIAQPCEEDWDKMAPTEQGRHCANCNKVVTDFSNYTDKELIDFLKKREGSSCSNFSEYQLNRPLLITEPTNHTLFRKLFFGTTFASWLGMLTNSYGQTGHTPTPVNQQTTKQKGANGQTAKSNSTDALYTIKGKVTDVHHLGIAEVQVTISVPNSDSAIATVTTDSTGRFSVSIPKNYNKQVLSASFYCPGYKDLDTKFTVKESVYLKMELEVVKRNRHLRGKF